MDSVFFVLSKLLFFALSPMVWIGLFLILSFCIKDDKLSKKLRIIALLIFLFFSNSAIQSTFMRWWEINTPPADSLNQKYTYAVVLGGMADRDPHSGKLIIERSIDRIIQAIILYKAEKVDKIVITGGSGELLNQDKKESIELKKFCEQLGVSPNDIIIEAASRNTFENAKYTKNIIPYKEERILLITSAFHMRRSSAIFKKAGYNFDILSTDPIASRLRLDDYFLPKAKAIDNWIVLLKEVAGYLSYKLVGYL
ncbi:MAG: YdcF family protein [Bacteroidales bacterium]|nr:YdcF family protein [Bacteroidales bacterium]